ncbi:hypothetical protein DM860_016746 [Cuscuta australis]|uniref:Uncharacterized protein n=1 Tax=Cuscuta australis TaxID=267555 RepID=A0A328DE26_9ASTE|nr:hypothetical protein DM860_016746 [Cuscuta australis]
MRACRDVPSQTDDGNDGAQGVLSFLLLKLFYHSRSFYGSAFSAESPRQRDRDATVLLWFFPSSVLSNTVRTCTIGGTRTKKPTTVPTLLGSPEGSLAANRLMLRRCHVCHQPPLFPTVIRVIELNRLFSKIYRGLDGSIPEIEMAIAANTKRKVVSHGRKRKMEGQCVSGKSKFLKEEEKRKDMGHVMLLEKRELSKKEEKRE